MGAVILPFPWMSHPVSVRSKRERSIPEEFERRKMVKVASPGVGGAGCADAIAENVTKKSPRAIVASRNILRRPYDTIVSISFDEQNLVSEARHYDCRTD